MEKQQFVNEVTELLSDFIEEMTEQDFKDNGTIAHRLELLYDYVNSREYSEDPNMFEDQIQRLEPLLQGLKANGDISMDNPDSSSYQFERFLQKYYLFYMLDFPDEASGSYFVDDKRELLFTLKDLSTLLDQPVTVIRNSVSKEGGPKNLRVISRKGVLTDNSQPVPETTFVTVQEALRWLEATGNDKPLKQKVKGRYIDQFDDEICRIGEFTAPSMPEFLEIKSEGALQTFYAPFDINNTAAKVVFCGITPGLHQAQVALKTYAEARKEGGSIDDALLLAKHTASFSGPMRNNLVKLLNHIGLHQWLGIEDCADLFNGQRQLVHYTSALRYPVFSNGDNYNGSPSILRKDSLRWQLDNHLTAELRQLGPQTLIIPLGPKVTEALEYLASKGVINEEQILSGLPHPSGANAERIAYFLGNKPREELSSRTNPDQLDTVKASLLRKLKNL